MWGSAEEGLPPAQVGRWKRRNSGECREEAIATLKTQLADAKVTLKEYEKKATEYAK